MKLKELPRSKVRYWLFRFQTEANGGSKATGSPTGLRKLFEDHEDFTGWERFNQSGGWDVPKKGDFLKMVPLRMGSNDRWNRYLKRHVPELGRKKSINVEK